MRAAAERARRTRSGATKLNWVLTAGGDEGARTVVSVFRPARRSRPIGQPLEERSLSDRYRYPVDEMITEYNTLTIGTSTRAATRISITRARTK